jgi:hypothetical protein
MRSLASLITTATALGAREHNMLAAAQRSGQSPDDLSSFLDVTLVELTNRALQAGVVRADLVPEDLSRLVAMFNSVLWTIEPLSDGRKRYVTLILDAMSTPTPSHLSDAVRRCRSPISAPAGQSADANPLRNDVAPAGIVPRLQHLNLAQ